jgi:hypothetical protein
MLSAPDQRREGSSSQEAARELTSLNLLAANSRARLPGLILASGLVAAAAENRGGLDGQKRHRLGDLRGRICDLAFWLLERRPRLSI